MKTVNELVDQIAERSRELADLPIDELRALFPVATQTPEECIRYCKESGLTRGGIIYVILNDEFLPEFTVGIDQETTEGWLAAESGGEE